MKKINFLHLRISSVIKSWLAILTLVLLIVPGSALAIDSSLIDQLQTPFYEPNAPTGSSCFGSGSLERFLQVEASLESGGNPTDIGNGAYGKYQYIDSTWRSTLQSYYDPVISGTPADQLYTHASEAPEAVQDAATYLKYSAIAIKYQGDVWKMAVVHYYPDALTNLSQWIDQVPDPAAGNKLTIRQYANSIVDSFNSGAGSNINIYANQAADFQAWQQKDGLADTPELYAVENDNAPPTTTQTNGTQTCGSSNAIVQTALSLAWPDTSHGATPSPAYVTAINQFNPKETADDCGVFVATVMRASGADPDYPASGTSQQANYLQTSGKYTIEIGITDVSQLVPGDILIIGGNSDPTSGHTFIYVGSQPGGNEASASYPDRAANLDTFTSLVDPLGRGTYMVARLNQ